MGEFMICQRGIHGKASCLIRHLLFACVLLAGSAHSPLHAQPAAAPPAPALLLANEYHSGIEVSRYLVSEKFDGVRAVWDGKTLRFRSGRDVAAPAWFTAKLPATPLDGELWLARGKFDELSGIVRKSQPVDDEWRSVSYLIFELPGAPGTFAERYARIEALVRQTGWPQLQAVEQVRVPSRRALDTKLATAVKSGGEGLMLHLADAPYVTGRSDVLLKMKRLRDTEGVVTAHLPGKGKYTGMMGALQIDMPDGRRFKLGTGFSDAVRKNPPPVGSVVTYTYRDFTSSGLPRFASFVRVRIDP